MENPFEQIIKRLDTIESLLLDIKHQRRTETPANHEEDIIMNVKQASAFLNLAVPTIYALTSTREIPHSKRGKKLYFSKKELKQWAMDGKRKTISEITKAK